MTAVPAAVRRRRRLRHSRAAVATPPLSGHALLLRSVLIAVLIGSMAFVLQLTVVSALQQGAAQQQLFDSFRASLAEETAPLGPVDRDGRALAPGTAVAFVEIPAIGLRQVVVEGTAGSDLFAGPGHRRDSPLPGQLGVSIIMGRRSAFGGPFGRLGELDEGDLIRATTGQGSYDFHVLGVRREGDPLPAPPESGEARLLLATADGRPLLPSGVLRIDAELEGEADPGPARIVSASQLPAGEQMLGADSSGMWRLAGWLQVMLALAVAAVWAWHRVGRAQSWIVFLPPLVLVGLYVSNHTAELLPNLL